MTLLRPYFASMSTSIPTICVAVYQPNAPYRRSSLEVSQYEITHLPPPRFMSPIIRRIHNFKSASDAYNVVAECASLIENLISARDDILDANKHRITKGIKTVSDNLSAVHSFLLDSGTQWLGDEVTEIVWITAGDEIWACYYACRDLQEVLLDAYTRLDLEAGAEVPKRLGRDLRDRGERANSCLRQVCETAKQLVYPQILTNARLLEDIEDALVPHPPSANTGGEVFGLILDCIDFIEDSIEASNKVRGIKNVPFELAAIIKKLPSLLEAFESVQIRRQTQRLDDRTWLDAGPDVIKCHAACERLAESLSHAYPRIRNPNRSFIGNQLAILKHDVEMAERHLVEIWQCLKLLLQRTIFTDVTLLESISTLAEPLSRKWTCADPQA